MTPTKWVLAFEWILGFLILPVVLLLCPIVAVWWWWNILTDSIEAERDRLARNEYLYRMAQAQPEEGKRTE